MPCTLATNAMGTRFELVLDGDDPVRLRAVGESALREIEEWHDRLSLFRPGSLLDTINERAADEPMPLDELTFELLYTCQQVRKQSQGAFDIAVAPLMRAWGLHPPGRDEDDMAVAEAHRIVKMDGVQLDPKARAVQFAHPGVAIDLGGVAKGFVIDLVIELLREHGIACALLHGGTSTVAAMGAPPGEPGWRVAVRTQPDGQSADMMPVVCLKNAALSVSAPHGRTLRHGGAIIGHVLDPRNGRPVRCGAFAAVVDASACRADAWSTALLVLNKRSDGVPRTLTSILPDEDANTFIVEGPNRAWVELPDAEAVAGGSKKTSTFGHGSNPAGRAVPTITVNVMVGSAHPTKKIF